MLVIVSDLHLTDGTSGQTIKEGAFRVFRERLSDLAYDASWRSDTEYRPISRVDVLLLGDICDVIRSAKWCAAPPQVRPWGDAASPEFAEMIADITNDILRVNAPSLAELKKLGSKGVTVPAATADARPAPDSRDPKGPGRVPVRVNLHYVIGNHDWFYGLPGPAFDAIRQSVVDAFGLCNSPSVPFPHDPAQSPNLRGMLAAHNVGARHGDIYDSMNFEGRRDASSLGDAIVIELLNRFPQVVKAQLGTQLTAECLDGLEEIDNVRPLFDIPAWLNGLLKRTCDHEQAGQVMDMWNAVVDDFLKLPFVTSHGHSEVFVLRLGLKLSETASLAALSGVATVAERALAWRPDDLCKHAGEERTSARFVVYGHTHDYLVAPLSAETPAQKGRFYLNSGTWRAVHQEVGENTGDFGAFHVMTYLAFYNEAESERKGRAFESWSGTLDRS